MPKISHKAKVIQADYDVITVKFTRQSACTHCEHKSSCFIKEQQEKIIEIPNRNQKKYTTGSEVNIIVDSKTGWVAVFYCYILPLIVVLITLFTTYILTNNEDTAAILSLSSILVYYLVLFMANKHIKKKVDFHID